MRKVNTKEMAEFSWTSPKGKFSGAGKEVSEALGRDPSSTDLRKRHPFDVEILRIPPGKIPYPYHSHSAQWEYYHVISGRGILGTRVVTRHRNWRCLSFRARPTPPTHQRQRRGPDPLRGGGQSHW